MPIYDDILVLATHFDKLAAKVTDLTKYRKRKGLEEKNKRGVIWLFEQMDKQTIGKAFREGGLTVDDMHQARKAAGFPPVDKEAPPWVHIIINIVDEINPRKRKAEYDQFIYSMDWSAAKNDEERKKVEENRMREREEQKQAFKKDTERGWIRFSDFDEWKYNYPLLFDQLTAGEDWFKETLKKNAVEQIKNKNKYEASKIKLENAFRGEPTQLPNGTVLYSAEKYAQEYDGEWVKKIGPNEWLIHWPDGRETYGGDSFVKRVLSKSQELYPTLLKVPPSYIEEIENKQPTEQQIYSIIQYTINHDPDRFLTGMIAYHTSYFIPGEEEDVYQYDQNH